MFFEGDQSVPSDWTYLFQRHGVHIAMLDYLKIWDGMQGPEPHPSLFVLKDKETRCCSQNCRAWWLGYINLWNFRPESPRDSAGFCLICVMTRNCRSMKDIMRGEVRPTVVFVFVVIVVVVVVVLLVKEETYMQRCTLQMALNLQISDREGA